MGQSREIVIWAIFQLLYISAYTSNACEKRLGRAGPDRVKCTALYLFGKSLSHVPHLPSKSDFGLSFAKPVSEVPQLSNPFIFFVPWLF
jgi:hypothetical protein